MYDRYLTALCRTSVTNAMQLIQIRISAT